MRSVIFLLLFLALSLPVMASERGGSKSRASGGDSQAGAVVNNDYEVPVSSARAPDCGWAMQFKDWGFSAGYVTDLCKLDLAHAVMLKQCSLEAPDKQNVRHSCVKAREIADEMYELVIGDHESPRARSKRWLRKIPVLSWLGYVL